VPLHDTAAAGLKRYLARRGSGSDDDPVFVDKRGRALRYIAVKQTYDRLVGKAGIKSRSGRRPRLHDLRHNAERRIIPGRQVESAGIQNVRLQEVERRSA
jgi:integrase